MSRIDEIEELEKKLGLTASSSKTQTQSAPSSPVPSPNTAGAKMGGAFAARAKPFTDKAEVAHQKDRAADKEYEELINSGEYREMTFGDVFKGFSRGYNTAEMGDAAFDVMAGGSDDRLNYYQEKMADDKYKYVTDNLLLRGLGFFSEQLGQYASVLTDPTTIATTATAAAAGGIMGSAAGGVGAVPGAITGGITGVKLSAAEQVFRLEGGLAYLEMVEAGVSKEEAEQVALFIGGVNAGLELFQLKSIAKAYKVLATNPATSNAAVKVAQKLLGYGVDIAKETGQEVAQEGVTIAGSNYARNKEGLETDSWDEVGDRLKNTAIDSAIGFGMMKAPGATISTRQAVKQNKRFAEHQEAAVKENALMETEVAEYLREKDANAAPVNEMPSGEIEAQKNWWENTLEAQDKQDANLGYGDWWAKKAIGISPAEQDLVNDFNVWREQTFGGSLSEVGEVNMDTLLQIYKEETGIDLNKELGFARERDNASPPPIEVGSTDSVKTKTPIETLANTAYNQLYGKKTDHSTSGTAQAKNLNHSTSGTDTTDYSNAGLKELTKISKGKSMTALPKNTETVGDKLRAARDFGQHKFTDVGINVMRLSRKLKMPGLYNAYNHARQSIGMAQFMIGGKGIAGKQHGSQRSFADPTKVIGKKSLTEIWEPIRSKGDDYYQAFEDYLRNYHNIDRMAQKKPVFGKDHSAEKSRAIVQKYKEKHPEFEGMAEEVWAYSRNLLQIEVEGGLISQEDMTMLLDMYPHYVTTKRNKPKNKLGKNKSWADGTIQKATGVFEDAVDAPEMLDIENEMARQTQRVLSAANTNVFKQKLLEIAINEKDNPEVNNHMRLVNVEKGIENPLDILEEDSGTPTSNFTPEGHLIVYKEGKKYTLELDEGLTYAVKEFEPSQDPNNLALKTAQVATEIVKGGITTYNPLFPLYNLPRDTFDAILYSKDLLAFGKNLPKAWKGIATNSEMWQLYQSLGGASSSFFDKGRDAKATHNNFGKDFTQNPVKTPLKKVGEVIETFNMTFEQVTRFAEFSATVEKGGMGKENLLQAAHNAAEITTNFGRGGTWSRNLSRHGSLYLNAGIQGFSRMVRRVKDVETFQEGIGLAARATVIGIIPMIINNALWGDDEEYQDMNDRDKSNKFLFHIGGEWYGIPRGRVVAMIASAAQETIDAINGEEFEVGAIAQSIGENIAPASPIENNLYMMGARVDLFEEDSPGSTWWGGDIESRKDQANNRPSQRYDSSTDEFSKWLGEKTGKSPKKINNLIDSFTGGYGDMLLPLLTPEAEQNPLKKKFTVDPTYSNTLSGDFYDLVDEYNWDKKDKEGDTEGKEIAGITTRYLNKQSRTISDLNKEIEEISANSNYSDETKRQKIDGLKGQINDIKKEAIETSDKFNQTVESVYDDSLELAETYAEREIARIERSESYTIEEKPQLIADVEARISENATDIAYAEANKQVFGAEYALETYNKDVYGEAKEANEKKGIDFDTYYDMYFAQKGYTTKKDRMMAILDVEDLSTADKMAAADYIANSSDTFLDGFANSISKGVEREFILAYDRRWSKRDKKREVLNFVYNLGLSDADERWLINTLY